MISFIPYYETARLLLLIGLFYMFVIIFNWKKNVTCFDKPQKPQLFFIFLVLIHLLFAFEGGDYYHYYLGVSRDLMSEGQEPFYHWLAKAVSNNYLLWRTIVWGGALLFFMLTAKRFNFDPYKAVFLLYVMYITLFDYARASLGMAVYFYGLSYWCKPIKHYKILSYAFIGPVLMYCSTFFHSSMYIACAASVLVFIPLNKKIIIAGLILFSISTSLVINVYGGILGMVLSAESSFLVDKVEEYSVQERVFQASVYEMIRRYVEYSTFFVPAILMSINLFNKKYNNPQHTAMIRLYKVMAGILLLSVSMLIVSQTIILFYRILFISFIAIVLLFYYCRDEGLISKLVYKSVIIVCLMQVFFNFSKRIIGGNLPWQ